MFKKINNVFIILFVIVFTLFMIISSCTTDSSKDDKDNCTDNDESNKNAKISKNTAKNIGIPEYEIIIVDDIEHNGDRIFTQGFEVHNDILYEGTGLHDETSLKKINPDTGEILLQKNIEEYFPENMYFGEGITIWDNEIIHLSWKKGKAYFYSLDFQKLDKEFSYNTQGWGLTNDGKCFIMSDGSSKIYYRDPKTFEIVKTIEIGVENINELEYVDGIIYANIWMKTFIIMIDAENGKIIGKIDARNLVCTQLSEQNSNAVLNGIAYDPDNNTFYLTGKECPLIYEVTFQPKD